MITPAQLRDLTPLTVDDLLAAFATMMQRALLCLTAFLATSSSFFGGNGALRGVEAQYLLGLGEQVL